MLNIWLIWLLQKTLSDQSEVKKKKKKRIHNPCVSHTKTEFSFLNEKIISMSVYGW